MTAVLIVSRFVQKCLLNAQNVNVPEKWMEMLKKKKNKKKKTILYPSFMEIHSVVFDKQTNGHREKNKSLGGG